MRVLVVGAGLGGLAAGLAAHRAGHQVTILERADTLRETGAGISVMPNGVLALDALGVGQPVRARAVPLQGRGGIRDHRGRLLLGTDQAAVEARAGAPVAVVARAWLHQLLAAALPAGTVRTGVAAHGLQQDTEAVRVNTQDGVEDADLVVAADGAGSQLRAQLLPDHPGLHGCGQFAARAIAWPGTASGDLPAGELLDRRTGERFGCAPMADGSVYWYTTWQAHAPTNPMERCRWLLARRAAWHPSVPALIAATDAREIHVDEIVRLARPLSTVTIDRVALLGDAAHAMTPDLGQGACQAFEDAATLAAVLQRATELADALRAYDAQRRPRTTALQRQATRSNRMLSLAGAPALLRDLTLQAIPQQLATSALARQFRFDPPEV